MKTVLLTGASSGIGKETVKYFHEKGWNVLATMRHPEKEKELTQMERVRCLRLDVTDRISIAQAITDSVRIFGGIDVLVNNAGYAVHGAFEAYTEEMIQKQYDVNVFGVFRMTDAILPLFKETRAGVIVNVTSIGGFLGLPLYSVYNSTKWALEGWAEALQYELELYNVRIKNVSPGIIKTDFYGRSQALAKDDTLTEVNARFHSDEREKALEELVANASEPLLIAKTIYKAANDKSRRLRYTSGKFGSMVGLKRILPNGLFFKLVKMFAG